MDGKTAVGSGGAAGAPLRDRVAVVTGASSGIGAAVAEALAGAGASVVLGARRADRIEQVAGRIREAGGEALARGADVTRRVDVEALVGAAREAYGPVDVLVNNAGVMPLSPVERLAVEEWERTIDVNVKGVLYALAAVLPDMLDRGSGHIVNVGSLAGRRPFPGGTVYSATKFAVRALSWGLHLELGAARGIRVTDVQPGVVDTELFDGITDEAIRSSFEEGWEGRRRLRPEDVARSVLHAVTSPDGVSVSEILVRPTDQPT